MASAAQIAANKQNAQLSTGPRTAEGKAIARLNAMKHGLLAEKVMTLADGEGEEFFQLYMDLHIDLDPEGSLEILLVDRVISLSWRLMRASKIEREVLILGIARCRGEDLQLGKAFRWDAEGADAISKISRYEKDLERSLFRTLHELERLQARRRGSHVPPPAVLDVQLELASK